MDKLNKYLHKLISQSKGEVIYSQRSTYYHIRGRVIRVSDHIGRTSDGSISIIYDASGSDDYKTNLNLGLIHTTWGKEYFENGILKKNIMDGYDAGWLSPLGEYYAGNGEKSSMIHMNIAEQIFNTPTNKYAIKMNEDGVSLYSSNSPEQWLTSHGWVKIHHNDCYGSFIGERNPNERTPEFPYHYCPTEIQVKMICDYADKFYRGKFYTEANCLGMTSHPDPYSTYKVRQMDEFKLHEIFSY